MLQPCILYQELERPSCSIGTRFGYTSVAGYGRQQLTALLLAKSGSNDEEEDTCPVDLSVLLHY
jgi:hypothetical protein